MRNVKERGVVNPYAKVTRVKIEIPTLEDRDLDKMAENPDAFFSNSVNRAKFFGMETKELKKTLASYSERRGVGPEALVVSIITKIEW